MSEKRNKIIELTAFFVLIVGMSIAGYVYQVYEGSMPKVVLVLAIIIFLLVLYLIYRLMVRFLVKW